MRKKQVDLEFENKHLEETVELAKRQLEAVKNQNENNKRAILEAKKEMRENTSHSISNLWSSEGFEALADLNQYAHLISNKIMDFENVDKQVYLLENMIKSPYFARIDFKFEDTPHYEKIYIGRASLEDDDAKEIVVYDWRAPIASVFYRYTLGDVHYEAPLGRINGHVNLKRQYEIKESKLEYFFDTDIQIVDEFLKKLLSQNASSKMKAIIETIQKDQDVVIRDMDNELMMVQGVAGSGKTSIALHRAAYLMYQGLTDKLSYSNIMIISPSSLFEQYISSVLPELGEHHVNSMIFEELIEDILGHLKIQSRYRFLENMMTNAHDRPIIKACIEYKTSIHFKSLLDRYIDELKMSGRGIDDVFTIYKSLITDPNLIPRLSRIANTRPPSSEILDYTRENLESPVVHYDDAIVLAYLHLKLLGNDAYKVIKQVVIDEAQDYYPLHFECLNLLFPKAKFTVLGDVNQTLEKQEKIELYEQIKNIFNKKRASLISMNKSFRCTNEILQYSLKFLGREPDIRSFNRQGVRPQVYGSQDQKGHVEEILSEIKVSKEMGYQSIGLLCKSEKNAYQIYDALKDKIDIQIIEPDTISTLHGVFIIPVYLSKGLEFDSVLICDVSSENYNTIDDRNLLYIACTRALHRLNLFYMGESSPHLKNRIDISTS